MESKQEPRPTDEYIEETKKQRKPGRPKAMAKTKAKAAPKTKAKAKDKSKPKEQAKAKSKGSQKAQALGEDDEGDEEPEEPKGKQAMNVKKTRKDKNQEASGESGESPAAEGGLDPKFDQGHAYYKLDPVAAAYQQSLRSGKPKAKPKAKTKAQAKSPAKKVESKKGGKRGRELKPGEDAGDNERLTFAKRPKPTKSPRLDIFLALAAAFEAIIRGAVRSPSKLEDWVVTSTAVGRLGNTYLKPCSLL